MKAVLCKELGLPDQLVVEEVASPSAGNGQVVVSVKACGVNFPDTLIIQGKYQFKPELPFSPGGEVAGVAVSPVMYVDIFPENLLLIASAVLLATLLSGLYPAWKAGRVAPVESIRLV